MWTPPGAAIAPAVVAALSASGVKGQQPPPHPHHATTGASPLLHPLSIVILLLAALGLASSFANMPFELLAARPSRSTPVKATPANPKVPDPTPIVKHRTWMGFLLIACLAVVSLQGPLGLTSGSQHLMIAPGLASRVPPVNGSSEWVPTASSLTLESAFYPLLIGAGALFIIFDYCT